MPSVWGCRSAIGKSDCNSKSEIKKKERTTLKQSKHSEAVEFSSKKKKPSKKHNDPRAMQSPDTNLLIWIQFCFD